jgi:hypothetical protein
MLQERQCACNVTLRHVLVAIVAVEKRKLLLIVSVSVLLVIQILKIIENKLYFGLPIQIRVKHFSF